MSVISETYADLGGLVGSQIAPCTPRERVSRTIDRSPGRVCDRHMFDSVSGWCGCGIRDDGKLAEGSPAWRAELDRHMPGPHHTRENDPTESEGTP